MLSHQLAASTPLADAHRNPRYCAAQDSILVPRKRQKLKHPSDDSGSISGMPSAPQPFEHPALRKENSQESEGNLSALKWFDNANSNIGGEMQHQPGYDNEPPFFISQDNPLASFEIIEHGVSNSKPFGEHSQHDSEKEDLRDVIDDLTIENKRLKQLLKNRRGPQNSQDRDKLFEVRVHRLPSDKKRELEEFLRTFALNLSTSSGIPSNLQSGPPPGAQKPHSGTIQFGRTDSGYASNSNSGQTSATPSYPGRPATATSRKNNDQTIKSYLHNIPNGLLPRQPLVMSARAKMSLVVRRLENLFTGKKAALGEYSQPQQQQEVSRLAATADMQRGSRHHRPEGSRQAHILPPESPVNLERLDSMESSSSDSKLRLATLSAASGKSTPVGINSASSAGRSPDQRPTRPLDLDVHRAQVAEENIEYIRHLGLTSPKLNAEADQEGREGWIYLNLLISMAQLHTINVTPAFIRKSIKKLSAKFELSEDGNKVRWKGGTEATQVPIQKPQHSDMVDGDSADDAAVLGTTNNGKQFDGMAMANGQTSATPSEDQSSSQPTNQSSMQAQPFSINPELTMAASLSRPEPASSFDYKPILLTGKSLSRFNMADVDESAASPWRFDSSSVADSTECSDGTANDTAAGPIVFYSSTLFCSDSSGDRVPTNMRGANWETSTCVLGVNATKRLDETRDLNVSYFSRSSITPVPEQPLGVFVFNLPPVVESRNAEPKLRDLPASGIGGVTLQDNFLIDVKIARTPPLDGRNGNETGVRGWEQRSLGDFKYCVVSCLKTALPPSQLPPPSYSFFPFTSSSSSVVDGAWDSEDDAAGTSTDEREVAPPAYLAQFSSEDSSPSGGGQDMETDSSVDMLASARVVAPTTIAAQEREFEVMRKRTPMDDEPIAKSLAATAGEGSDTDSGAESDVDEAGSYVDSDDEL